MTAPVRSKDRAHRITKPNDVRQVYAHLTVMPLAAHVSGNPHLLSLAEEAIDASLLSGATVRLQRDMGRTIGRSELVDTKETDTIFFARQSKTSGYTRFVKNRDPEQTMLITLYLIRDDEGDYELTNIWVGEDHPPEPDTYEATGNSLDFWSSHAVVYNGQPIISSTLTKTCPY